MFGFFKKRQKDREEWFSIDYPGLRIEGRKKSDGYLHLSIRQSQGTLDIAVERDVANQLADWMIRNFPSEKNNVVRFPRKLKALDNDKPE